jgi:hypothetical protein
MTELVPVFVALISMIGSVAIVAIPLWLRSHMQDQQAAEVLGNAVRNSLGALQKAAEDAARGGVPGPPMPGIPRALVPGVQYVLDHAGEEAARFNITPEAIGKKIEAQIGLENIKANEAKAAPPLAATGGKPP